MNDMRAQVITIPNNKISDNGFLATFSSSQAVGNSFEVLKYTAFIPDNVELYMDNFGIKWTYPWDKTTIDLETGLELHPYKPVNRLAKMSCAMSHYVLWDFCAMIDVPFIIMEHDCLWKKKLDAATIDQLLDSKYGAIGLNSPERCTRKWQEFMRQARTAKNDKIVIDCPMVEPKNTQIPQGLAGGSCYLIKPDFAKKVVDKVYKMGLWHNDALLCNQLFPGKLGVTTSFYTTVNHQMDSTTTK